MATTSDHDVQVKNDVVKKDAPHPHADGCVGCRRQGLCVKCGKSALFDTVVCRSGACSACCAAQHRHANDDINDIVLAGAVA